MAVATLCDQCKTIVVGEQERVFTSGDKWGTVCITLEDSDWCPDCARKAFAALAKTAWHENKQTRGEIK